MIEVSLDNDIDLEETLQAICYSIDCCGLSCEVCPLASKNKLIATLNELLVSTNKI